MQYLNAIYHEKQLLKDGAFIYICFMETKLLNSDGQQFHQY